MVRYLNYVLHVDFDLIDKYDKEFLNKMWEVFKREGKEKEYLLIHRMFFILLTKLRDIEKLIREGRRRRPPKFTRRKPAFRRKEQSNEPNK